MECSVCDLRGAVQACGLCHSQICEVCGVNCRRCGKPVCPSHVYKTHSGKLICLDCQRQRAEKRAQIKAMAERAEAAESADISHRQLHESSLSEDEALVASVRTPVPPWKLSVYAGAVGFITVLIILAAPSLRQIPMPGGSTLATPYFLMIIPAAALAWAFVGLINEQYGENRPQCLAGLVLAVVTVVLMLVAVATDPAKKAAEEAAQAQLMRTEMNPQELEEWRNQRLNRFRR